jgi:DNA-directed RNA polymerase specialized sigma subunit
MLSYMQQLKRTAADARSEIRIPEAMQYDAKRMQDAEGELQEKLDRDPSDAELSDHLSMPLKRIGRLRRLRPGSVYSGAFLEQQDQPEVEDTSGEDMWQDFVYHDLPATDKLIFEHRTGYNGKPVLGVAQLARKLGISPGMISRRAAGIAQMINKRPKGW